MANKWNIQWNQVIAYVFALLAIIILLSSCSSARKANRGIKKLEKLKVKYADVWDEVSTKTIRIDTVIQEVEVYGETRVKVDSFAIDSLVREINSMLENPQIDTVKGDIVRETITRYVPRFFDVPPLNLDTLDIELNVFYDKQKMSLHYTLKRDSIVVSKEEKVEQINPIQYITINKIPWWYWLIVCVLGIIAVRLALKSNV